MTQGPELHFSKDEYANTLIRSLQQTENRILLETMILDDLGIMHEVLDECIAARKRGVAVLVVYDIFSYGVIAPTQGIRQTVQLRERLRELRRAGADIQQVGAIEMNPFAGRHHTKAVIADNTVYLGGGINLSGESFHTEDYMIKVESKDLADALYTILPQAAADRPVDSVIYKTAETEVLLDGGKRGLSLIYDRTCELAEQADKIWYVSKLAPDGKLQKILKDKNVESWFNSIASASSFDKLAIMIDQRKGGIKNRYAGESMLHAKFCVFQMSDGSLEAITGSHNFNSRGVNFGTQELALHTRHQGVIQQLLAYSSVLDSL